MYHMLIQNSDKWNFISVSGVINRTINYMYVNVTVLFVMR